jgi:hypothetical protein
MSSLAPAFGTAHVSLTAVVRSTYAWYGRATWLSGLPPVLVMLAVRLILENLPVFTILLLPILRARIIASV